MLSPEEKQAVDQMIKDKITEQSRRQVELDAALALQQSPDVAVRLRARDRLDSLGRTSATVYYSEYSGSFSAKIRELWRYDTIIGRDLKIKISAAEWGLQSALVINSEYEQGYHNDSGQQNDFYLQNPDLLALIIDLQKFVSTISMERVPVDIIVKNLMPSIVEKYLLVGDQ